MNRNSRKVILQAPLGVSLGDVSLGDVSLGDVSLGDVSLGGISLGVGCVTMISFPIDIGSLAQSAGLSAMLPAGRRPVQPGGSVLVF